jgi:two-component system response regulator PilR (NtrC family)
VALLSDGQPAAAARAAAPIGDGFNLDEHLRAIELELVRNALEQEGWNRTEASRRLGITPRSLRYLMRKHGLTDPLPSDKN